MSKEVSFPCLQIHKRSIAGFFFEFDQEDTDTSVS
jgi:hypothetical protein